MAKEARKELPAPETQPPPDILESIMGDIKPWQFIICLWLFYCKFSTAYHLLATVFFTAPMNFTCSDPDPATPPCSDACKKRTFDQSVFQGNVISEWDLVCSRSYLASFSQSVVMLGIMVGSMLFGTASDKYGRRPAFLATCFMQLILSPIVSFSTWFWLFCVLRFLVCVATGGMMIISFVIILEVIGRSQREMLTLAYQVPFTLGHASLALYSYFLRHWTTYNMGISVSSILFIVYIWVIPETPRWLYTTGRLDKAAKILESAAKFNKMPTKDIKERLEEAYRVKIAAEEAKKGTLADLFRNSNLRIRTLVMAFDWLAVCLTFYGTAQYISGLTGNIFVNVALGAILGVPGILVTIPLTKTFGRKYPFICSNLLSGVALLAIAISGQVEGWTPVILAGIGILGAAMTFSIAYLYSGELFPTVVRNSGVGFSSFVGRTGSIVAPFVAQTHEIAQWLPPLIFGAFSIVAALSVLLLPETKGAHLPDTIEQGEAFGKKNKET